VVEAGRLGNAVLKGGSSLLRLFFVIVLLLVLVLELAGITEHEQEHDYD
jgi:hypothetical protein